MPIKINGSTSGSVTLAAPATGSDVTLTLPTLGFGKVLQVVAATYSTSVDSTTASFIDTGLTATITPSSASSKILVIVNQAGCNKTGNAYGSLRLVRGSTTISTFESQVAYTATTAENNVGACSTAILDSPATTSATTYKTQVANPAATGTFRVNHVNVSSSILLVEVGP